MEPINRDHTRIQLEHIPKVPKIWGIFKRKGNQQRTAKQDQKRVKTGVYA